MLNDITMLAIVQYSENSSRRQKQPLFAAENIEQSPNGLTLNANIALSGVL